MNQLIGETLLLPILPVLFISISSSAASAQSWTEGSDMPTARSEIIATNIGDEIYVIGGFDKSGNPLDVVEVYNVKDECSLSCTGNQIINYLSICLLWLIN